MDPASLTKLGQLSTSQQKWEVNTINITVAQSLENDSPVLFNFASTLGHPKLGNASESKIYLQKTYNKNDKDSRAKLKVLFVKACADSGSEVFMKGWESKRQLIRFCCFRGRIHKPRPKALVEVSSNQTETPATRKTKTPATRKTSTMKQKQGTETCKFGFSVYWDQAHSRWYVKRYGGGCREHCGQFQKDSENVRQPIQAIGEHELEVAKDACNVNIQPGALRALVLERTGVCLSDSQLRKIQDDAPGVLMNVPGSDNHPSAGDRLFRMLKDSPETSYVALFAEIGTNLLTIPKMRLRIRNKSGESSQLIDNSSLTDAADSAEEMAQGIRRALSVNGTQQIVLAVAWTTDESRRQFEMYPEVLASDVTMQTNSEKRPLGLCVGLSRLKNTFTPTWAFLPSQSRWVFQWLFATAIPTLHSAKALKHVAVNLTDQDDKEFLAFESCCGPEGVYPKAVHRLCGWHKINRGFVRNTGITRLASNLRGVGKFELKVVEKWLWSWISEIL